MHNKTIFKLNNRKNITNVVIILVPVVHALVCGLDSHGFSNALHKGSHPGVSGTQSLYIVTPKSDFNLVVNVEPLGMMVHFIRQECYSSHEAKSLNKIQNYMSFLE